MRFYPKESNKKVNSNYIPTASVKQRLVDANKLEESVKITDKPAWMVVRDAPTVDAVEVVHGQWIHHYYDSGEPIDSKWYCSECAMCNNHKRTWYCPHCGAKMDREGKDNERKID